MNNLRELLEELLKIDDRDSMIVWLLQSRLQEIHNFLQEAETKFPENWEKLTKNDVKIINSVKQEFEKILLSASPDRTIKQSQKTVSTTKEDSDSQKDNQIITSDLSKFNPLRDSLNSDKDKEAIKYLDNLRHFPPQKYSDLWNKVLLENNYKNLSDDLKLLACLVFIWIYSINREDRELELYHGLESVYMFDIVALKPYSDGANKYIKALKESFKNTIKAEKSKDSIQILKAWIDIDEAIHSLVSEEPAADSDSWLGKFKKRSRRILIKKAENAQQNNEVRIRELLGVYANVHKLSSKYDIRLKKGGIPGEVQTCLRVYARINQKEYPGRVIFRSFD